MKLMMENWRKFVKEQTLEESVGQTKKWFKQKGKDPQKIKNFISDIKKAFLNRSTPEMREQYGPDFLDKYMFWLVKNYFKESDTGAFGLDWGKMESDTNYAITDMTSAVGVLERYADNLSRNLIPDEGKDINGIKSFGEMIPFIEQAEGVVTQAMKKEQAKENTDVLYKDDNFLLVRPFTEGASCHYGVGTTWCIAATESENWFDHYSEKQGRAIYILFNRNLPRADLTYKIAFVGTSNEILNLNFSEIRNVMNRMLDLGEVEEAIAKNLSARKDISQEELNTVEDKAEETLNKIIDLMHEHVQENPPGPNIEEEIEKIEQKARENLKHYGLDIDYEVYEGDYIYYSASTSFKFSGDDFDWVGDNLEDKIQEIIVDRTYLEVEVEKQGDGEYIAYVDIDVSQDYEFTPDLEGLENFYDYIERLDSEYEGLREEITDDFEENGLVSGNESEYFEKIKNNIEEATTPNFYDFDKSKGNFLVSANFGVNYKYNMDNIIEKRKKEGIWEVSAAYNSPNRSFERNSMNYLDTRLKDAGVKVIKEAILEELKQELTDPRQMELPMSGLGRDPRRFQEKEFGISDLDPLLSSMLSFESDVNGYNKHAYLDITFRVSYSEDPDMDLIYIKIAEVIYKLEPYINEVIAKAAQTALNYVAKVVDDSLQPLRQVSESKKRFVIRILKS